jgi:hypothetical protein
MSDKEHNEENNKTVKASQHELYGTMTALSLIIAPIGIYSRYCLSN